MTAIRVLGPERLAPPSEIGAARYASELLRHWHLGRSDAVAQSLERESAALGWRLMLDAVRFLRDPTCVPLPRGAKERSILLSTIVTMGGVAAAKAFLAATTDEPVTVPAIAELHTLIAHAPTDAPDGAAPDLLDDPARDVQVTACPGARTVIFVFTGGAQRFNGPLRLIHAWLRRLGASIVYLRDLHGMHFLGGVPSLGDGYRETVRALRRLAADLGCPRIVCTGSSSGSFGALRYGLDLPAERVLCFAGPTVLDDSLPELLRRERLRGAVGEPVDPTQLDLAALYAAADRRPALRLVYGGANRWDRAEAERMGDVPGVELVPIPGLAQHGVVPYLLPGGAFGRHLAWLAGGVAPGTRPLTPAPAGPT
ncbi:hypothetical protein [Stella sp.]|uniref:hypothetical protein n=1 Tax=Stella sp. TaxID=2912054 RepID=UPI0035AFB04B